MCIAITMRKLGPRNSLTMSDAVRKRAMACAVVGTSFYTVPSSALALPVVATTLALCHSLPEAVVAQIVTASHDWHGVHQRVSRGRQRGTDKMSAREGFEPSRILFYVKNVIASVKRHSRTHIRMHTAAHMSSRARVGI